MGRFASTASLYEHLRPPYPGELFRNVAQKLGLSRESSLIDLGTGPGLLALGFGPYVGRVVGVDPEPAMIEAAHHAARGAGRHVTLIEGKAETLAPDIGSFDIVTIGRALHWMDRDPTLALLDWLVAHDGVIAICAAFSATDGRNPWLDGYNEIRRRWSPVGLWKATGRGTHGLTATLPHSFAAARFGRLNSSQSRPATWSAFMTWRNAHSPIRRHRRTSWAKMSRICCAMSESISSRSAATARSPRLLSRRRRS
ncbi:SAM-dependent methyltransferase [Bradyrhizobium liaoningense]